MRTRAIGFASLALLGAMVFALAGCGGGQGGSPGGGYGGTPAGTPAATGTDAPAGGGGLTVVEKSLAFDPTSLEVKVGDVVTFTNEDSLPHNVNIDGADLGQQSGGDSVTWTARDVGTFPYSCTIHPSMTGEIVVR